MGRLGAGLIAIVAGNHSCNFLLLDHISGVSTGGGGEPPPPDCDSKTMCCDDPGSGNPVSYLSGAERLRYTDL